MHSPECSQTSCKLRWACGLEQASVPSLLRTFLVPHAFASCSSPHALLWIQTSLSTGLLNWCAETRTFLLGSQTNITPKPTSTPTIPVCQDGCPNSFSDDSLESQCCCSYDLSLNYPPALNTILLHPSLMAQPRPPFSLSLHQSYLAKLETRPVVFPI